MEFCFVEDCGLFAVSRTACVSDYGFTVGSDLTAPYGPIPPFLLVDQATDWDGNNTYVTYDVL